MIDRTKSFESSPSGSPVSSRRRSRASNSDFHARMRGLSFSAIAPVVAQANWLAQQVRFCSLHTLIRCLFPDFRLVNSGESLRTVQLPFLV